MLALLLISHAAYPRGAALSRYDFLVLAALSVQALMLATKLETWEEAKVIFLFHIKRHLPGLWESIEEYGVS